MQGIIKMHRWHSPQAPAAINPRFFDPVQMFPPIVIPASWNEPYFFPRTKQKRVRKKSTTRRIYLIRNGEPAEFGGRRNNGAFCSYNKLAKMDTSQAVVTVTRTGGPDNYADDPPLTQIGRAGAELVGRSLSERSLHIHTIYTSPSLRCLQTATAIISALNCRKPSRLRIEPALFEPLSFIDRVPQFLSSRDLRANGYMYDEHYEPVMSVSDLKSSLRRELRPSDIQMRVEKAVNRILSGRKQEGGILVISHAPILDTVYRLLTNRQDTPRTMGDMQRMIHNYPRCSVTILQYDPINEIWEKQQNTVPSLSYWHATSMVNVPRFD